MLSLTLPFLVLASPANAPSVTTTGLDLVPAVLSEAGCAPKLLGDARFPFYEAQAACDAYLGIALVDEVLSGAEREPRVRALEALITDLESPTRGGRAFRSFPSSVLY